MVEAIRRDRRRREEKVKEMTYNNKELDSADFTAFMATFDEQNQVDLPLNYFTVRYEWLTDIEVSIRTARNNKSPGRYCIHNEMLKLDASSMERVILELWRLVGKSKLYPNDWKRGLMTPVHKE